MIDYTFKNGNKGTTVIWMRKLYTIPFLGKNGNICPKRNLFCRELATRGDLSAQKWIHRVPKLSAIKVQNLTS
jgi:hypothetical protein